MTLAMLRRSTIVLLIGVVALTATAARSDAAPRKVSKRLQRSRLARNLRMLTKAPDGRAPDMPSYMHTARRVAAELQRHGLKPAGNGKRGLDRYLQGFSWDVRGGHRSANIVAIRPGRSSKKKGEAIVVLAHLDGLTQQHKEAEGIGRYQGANDNASGVTALLRVSETLGRWERLSGKKLERDLIFVVTSLEEEGNIGAEAFARFPGQLAGKRVVAAINFDMVGLRAMPESPLQGVGLHTGRDAASARQNPLSRRASRVRLKGSDLSFFAGHRRVPKAFDRSDQAVFNAGGVPSLLYMGAVPKEMHTSRDTLGRIDLETVDATARHGARLIKRLASKRSTFEAAHALPLKLKKSATWGDALAPATIAAP